MLLLPNAQIKKSFEENCMKNSVVRMSVILSVVLVAILAIVSQQRLLAEATAVEGDDSVPCVNGMAGAIPCKNVDFLSYTPLIELGTQTGSPGANLWGWTDSETGKEYVLYGMVDSLAILDISDPVNPVQVGILPNHTITNPQKYRDVKVYKDYAFVIADELSFHGMQVFDLTQVRGVTQSVTFSESAYFDGFGTAHNLFINEDTGYAYVVRTTEPGGNNPCGGAVYMVNIQDPLNPTSAGCFAEASGLASDSMCVLYHGPDEAFQGRELCIIASDDDIIVGDVTDKITPTVLADLTYPDIMRAHLAWLTEDHQFFVSADMNDEMMMGLNTRIFIWDFRQVMTPTLMGYYEGASSASDHNVWVNGDYAYVGNFRAGVRILDLHDIASTTMTNVTVFEAGYFDLYPDDDNAGHDAGAWAVYPFFESGVVAVSDKAEGLTLLRPDLIKEIYLPFVANMP
jgi:choice-of-anchor B domain-containing protein